jgi:hypothetical protein
MNIFVLDLDPQKCAEYHCDKHLVKRITEHNQILGSIAYTARGVNRKADITSEFVSKVFPGFPRKIEDRPHPYGIGYKNHPCTTWAGKSLNNYQWLCTLTAYMCKEYTKRYGRKHAGEDICRWYADNHPNLPMLGITQHAQAMPDDCKIHGDVVTAYRNYYKKYKSSFAKWAHSPKPEWFNV